ncbi:MAG: hypothetical protein WDM88_01870 [Galbitalea sp.]
MFGADVDELNALANQMEQASNTLSTSRARISSQVSNSAWIGPVADRFRSDWSSTNSSRLASAINLLSSAATSLRQNAEQQSQASAADRSSPSGSSTSLNSGEDPISHIGDLLNILGNGGESISDINLLSDLKFLNESPLAALDKYLGPIGMVLSAGSVTVDLHEHDMVAALMDGVSGVAGTVSTVAGIAAPIVDTAAFGAAATGLGVVGAGIGAGVLFVNATLPYSSSSQDAMIKYVLQEQYGSNTPVDTNNLTSEQSQFISQRYEGPFGVAQMISDKMDQTGQPIQQAGAATREWVANTAVPAVEHAASDVGHAAAEFGSFVGSLAKGIKL